MHICTECGRVSEEDMEFCPHCGSMKGANVNRELIPPQFKIVSNETGTYIVKQNIMKIRLALLFALFPGIIDIFGLGHLIMGRYVRAAFFGAFSVLYYYERFTGYVGFEWWHLMGITLAVFVVQMFDIFRIVKEELGIESK